MDICDFKKLLAVALMLLASSSFGEVVTVRHVTISQMNAYDDAPGVAAYLYLTSNLADCPKGAYINPNADYFESLYSMALAAFLAQKTVHVQMYNDRLNSGRCEVDGLQVLR